ncbi:MAG: hypothetical protein DMF89_07030 [Acidobacteria bacterium]|nr:MAG: hypothetical protein DMF89_07030 [Acidobacteriota bacterium]
MRALLSAVGTRGDVQPALALALELRKLGHAVRMCISPNFVDWARSLGLEAVAMGVEISSRISSRPSVTPSMAATSSSAPTRTSMQRRRLPSTQALAV